MAAEVTGVIRILLTVNSDGGDLEGAVETVENVGGGKFFVVVVL